VGFLDKKHGEDTDFAVRLYNQRLLMCEASVRKPLYFYYFKTKTTATPCTPHKTGTS
jgi:hypothetical protein